MIEKGGFDIVGHVDKITYHVQKYKDFNVGDQWYKNLMTSTLERIKNKGLLLEINTKSLREHGLTYPHHSFYPLINELQIPILVNSDCHYPTNVTDGFRDTYKALKKAGFQTLQVLNNGHWETVTFNENGWED